MTPDKELYKLASQAIKDVYDGECVNYGSTEWALTIPTWNDKKIQVLAVGGSDEFIDWMWNVILVSKEGVKYCSWLSAERLHDPGKPFSWRRFKLYPFHWFNKKIKSPDIDPGLPLMIAVHSKSGPTGIQYARKFGADYVVAFCPARGLRKAEKMDNVTIFIDPNDPVPKLGALSFKQPDCLVEKLPDEGGIDFSDHSINHIIEWQNNDIS